MATVRKPLPRSSNPMKVLNDSAEAKRLLVRAYNFKCRSCKASLPRMVVHRSQYTALYNTSPANFSPILDSVPSISKRRPSMID